MKIALGFLLACLLAAAAWGQEATLTHNSNLRSEATSQSKSLGLLPAGTAVTITSTAAVQGYVQVKTADGAKTGWVWQKNVKETETGGGGQTPANGGPPNVAPGARVGDPEIYPNAQMTPGKADPRVTQDNIGDNICNKGWSTGSVRPPVAVTNKIKVQTMKAYGFTDAANHYELDHLMSLQVGGCPDCVENLWPEAYGDQKHPMTQNERAAWNKQHPGATDVLPGSLEKDLVENHVHDEICFGIPNAKMSMYAVKYPAKVKVTLARGQEILATDWYACYQKMLNGNQPCE